MTECSESLFPFEAHFSRQVVAQFEESWLATEGGSLLSERSEDLTEEAGGSGAGFSQEGNLREGAVAVQKDDSCCLWFAGGRRGR